MPATIIGTMESDLELPPEVDDECPHHLIDNPLVFGDPGDDDVELPPDVGVISCSCKRQCYLKVSEESVLALSLEKN